MAWKSLNQFSRIVKMYTQNYDSNDLSRFIKFIDVQLEVNYELLEPLYELAQMPAVRVMTVHSSKGMEFKHVFIPFLRSGSDSSSNIGKIQKCGSRFETAAIRSTNPYASKEGV